MKKLLPILFLNCIILVTANSQIVGGNNVYEFLNLSPSARVTALGENLISVKDDDAALVHENPGLLNPLMHNQFSVSHQLHLSDIQHGFVNYAREVAQWDMTFHAGMQYINYGDFKAADETGVILGDFKASEYAFNLGAGKQLYEKLSVGANLKFITSQFESYNSTGLGMDLGAYYQDTSSLLSIGFVLKNIGAQLTTYADEREPFPYDMQIGISQRLRHLPFRFTATYHNLNRWNIRYDDPDSEEDVFLLGETQDSGPSLFAQRVDNFFRHLSFSGEFLLGKRENFRLRIGYNHLRRKELTVDNFRSLSGFTGGIGIKINRFRIDYGHAFYHIAGGLSHFTLSTDIGSFRKIKS